MITLDEIKRALANREYQFEVHEEGLCTRSIGPRGGKNEITYRWRQNGALKTWKRDTSRFSLPIKRGLKEYEHITEDNAHLFHLSSGCPLLATDGVVMRHQPVRQS
jgi:hypothetical protein